MTISVQLVALPIGNVDDLSPRAVEALKQADRIFCEDTRKLKELLKRAAVESSARFVALPGGTEHSFDWLRLVREAKDESAWVLVSDAGTPLVNDPGASLVEFSRRSGLALSVVPGPCAPIAAWQWSGGFGLPFLFAGFAPKAKNPGAKDLKTFFSSLQVAQTFVFFDTRHQFSVTLRHLIEEGLSERPLHVAREISKPHEELISGTVGECLSRLEAQLASEDALGEMTFVLKGEESAGLRVDLASLVQIRSASVKEAAKAASALTGLPSQECYRAFVEGEEK